MSTANDALLVALGQEGIQVYDCLGAPNTAQATATKCIGQANRFTTSVAGGSAAAVLPSVVSNEAQFMVFVINDTPNTIKVFPFTGENNNGAGNGTLSIPAGQSGIFIRVPPAVGKGGGGGGTTDWRSAAIP